MRSPVLTKEQATHMRAWISDLRSGQFPQGTSLLRQKSPDGGHAYCCIGVAAERAIRDGCQIAWDGPSRVYDSSAPRTTLFGMGSSTVAIPLLIAWYGFETSHCKIQVECRQLGKRGPGLTDCPLDDYTNHNFAGCEQLVKVDATALNDVFAWDFNRIADAFEYYYFGGPEVSDETA